MSRPTILDELADAARARVAREKTVISAEEMEEKARTLPKKAFAFEKALASEPFAWICECKKASPSKGLIADQYDPAAIARDYEAAGASCISVLTEPSRFLGSDEDLQAVRAAVSLPILRKDFTIDPYMIFQARVLGADAVLLIASLLDEKTIQKSLALCDELGLSALCEAHDEQEIDMLIRAGARIIGVNNRNLKTFSVDTGNALSLRDRVPRSIFFISESGIQQVEQIPALIEGGVSGVLIGEMLMKADDRKATLQSLKQAAARAASLNSGQTGRHSQENEQNQNGEQNEPIDIREGGRDKEPVRKDPEDPVKGGTDG